MGSLANLLSLLLIGCWLVIFGVESRSERLFTKDIEIKKFYQCQRAAMLGALPNITSQEALKKSVKDCFVKQVCRHRCLIPDNDNPMMKPLKQMLRPCMEKLKSVGTSAVKGCQRLHLPEDAEIPSSLVASFDLQSATVFDQIISADHEPAYWQIAYEALKNMRDPKVCSPTKAVDIGSCIFNVFAKARIHTAHSDNFFFRVLEVEKRFDQYCTNVDKCFAGQSQQFLQKLLAQQSSYCSCTQTALRSVLWEFQQCAGNMLISFDIPPCDITFSEMFCRAGFFDRAFNLFGYNSPFIGMATAATTGALPSRQKRHGEAAATLHITFVN
ncbi:unnamed protein product [Soboliphyme baturini]|uniref:Chondroitin proteoglycan 4 domain-containing protein n=1 Tax=Soboliphyme baturini TaxID=241478 RepID=A0A183ITV4_9BILA|nr:unnamed protein product [Soboliphyme baturini]